MNFTCHIDQHCFDSRKHPLYLEGDFSGLTIGTHTLRDFSALYHILKKYFANEAARLKQFGVLQTVIDRVSFPAGCDNIVVPEEAQMLAGGADGQISSLCNLTNTLFPLLYEFHNHQAGSMTQNSAESSMFFHYFVSVYFHMWNNTVISKTCQVPFPSRATRAGSAPTPPVAGLAWLTALLLRGS